MRSITTVRSAIAALALVLFAGACTSGQARVIVYADSGLDPYTQSPTEAEWQWMRDHYDRMVVWSPYWDSRLQHFDDVLVYLNSYAIYVNSGLAQQRPDWIMREADGSPTYLNFACGASGGCSQYAGDLGNPEFVQHQLQRIQSLVDKGYPGIVLDDVNMAHRWASAGGDRVTPVDSRTGQEITLEAWRTYMADFVSLVRSTFPDLEIAHNAIWFADAPEHDNPHVDRQIAAADLLVLERGATDGGLTGGTGRWSLQAFLSYVDRAHELGTSVALLDEGGTEADQIYNLAATLLVNSGLDLVGSESKNVIAPDRYWNGFTTDLGDATGTRWTSNGFILRGFEQGFVVLREPGRAAATYALPAAMHDLDGNLVSSVTLSGGEAMILRTP